MLTQCSRSVDGMRALHHQNLDRRPGHGVDNARASVVVTDCDGRRTPDSTPSAASARSETNYGLETMPTLRGTPGPRLSQANAFAVLCVRPNLGLVITF